jgi:hydroxymethylglutaryl-CoA reductase (NADPH)
MSTSNPVTKSSADVDALVRDLVEGRRRFHELPSNLSAEDAARIRRRALEKKLAVRLRSTGSFTLDAARAASRHCENFIGAAQVPVGVAGPLKIQGQWVSEEEEIFVPLATTEGALVASINRGCQALREAGGAILRVEDVGMTRAPVFKTAGIDESQRFVAWIREHEEDIRRVTERTSRHLRLLEVRPQVLGTTIYLRFRFDSGDAMGMNMVTVACDRVVRTLIEPQTGVPCVALSGNL